MAKCRVIIIGCDFTAVASPRPERGSTVCPLLVIAVVRDDAAYYRNAPFSAIPRHAVAGIEGAARIALVAMRKGWT